MSQPEHPSGSHGQPPGWSGHQGYGPAGGAGYYGYTQPGWQGGPQHAQPYPGPYGYYEDPYAKSRLAAGLLGIFLGGFGIHRFYLGHVGIGIVQILVTVLTAGVGAIWGFVEGILYLTARTGTFSRDASGRPLRW